MDVGNNVSFRLVNTSSANTAHCFHILNSMPFAVTYIDKDLRFTYLNAACEKFLGKQSEAIIGKTIYEVLGKKPLEQMTAQLDGTVLSFETELRLGKSNRVAELTFTPDFNEEKEVCGYSVIINEITANNNAKNDLSNNPEDALHESEYQYRQLIEKFPIAVYTCDAKGYIRLYNRAAVDLWGREPVAGKDMWCGSWKIYQNDGTLLPLDKCPMAIALKEGRSVYGEEINVQRPDGTILKVMPHPQPIFDSKGNIVGAINMLLDITDRKKAEEINAKLAAIVQSSDDAIIGKTLEGIVTSWNKAAERMFGYTASEMTGQSILKIIPEERVDEEPKILERLRRGESIEHFETIRVTKDGTRLNISLTISPIKDSKGNITGASKIARDITKQKQLLEALETGREELESQVMERTADLKRANLHLQNSNEELERFAYVASHDLQEPLRKIQAFGNLLLERNEQDLNNNGKNYVNRMINAANRMQSLIEALLEFSRATLMEKKFEKRDLNLLIDEVIKEFQERADDKEAIIEVAPLPHLTVIPFQFKQMLSNIISNSLKYSKPDEKPVIEITSQILDEQEINDPGAVKETSYCKLTISDNGIGFENEHAERIFELFQRLHGRHEYGGSGIGLSICKKIMENHEGFIRAESKPGKGATFHIYIPNK